jgi:hypothetical protein
LFKSSIKRIKEMKIIAFDPGVTTGFAQGILDNGLLQVGAGQAQWNHQMLWQQLQVARPDIVICESFEFRQQSRAGLILYSVELIGIIHLYCGHDTLRPVELVMQTAAKGKGYYNNTVLQKNNVYARGIPHGMDAMRHLLHWYTFGAGFKYNTAGFKPLNV